ncbi:MAG: hypothetical protein JNJ54_34955 [Myxococcaceae bacterium]|nr:hypothetical protein [Myxococcaceae bacterium]
MALTTLDGLVAASKQRFNWYKASVSTEGAGTFSSLWTAAGFPSAGATPATGSGAIPDRTTTGAFPLTAWAGGAAKKYLARLAAAGATAGQLIIYDRLWHNSGLSGTTTTSQTINSTALTRYPTVGGNYVGVEPWLEVYTAYGATGSTFTLTYTNEAGTGSRTSTYTHPANAPTATQMIPFPFQAGDKGVQSIQSFSLTPSTATAGNFGFTLLHRLAQIPISAANAGGVLNFLDMGGAELLDGACLSLMVLCSATSTGIMTGDLTVAEG